MYIVFYLYYFKKNKNTVKEIYRNSTFKEELKKLSNFININLIPSNLYSALKHIYIQEKNIFTSFNRCFINSFLLKQHFKFWNINTELYSFESDSFTEKKFKNILSRRYSYKNHSFLKYKKTIIDPTYLQFLDGGRGSNHHLPIFFIGDINSLKKIFNQNINLLTENICCNIKNTFKVQEITNKEIDKFVEIIWNSYNNA
jgi:hypothetical protein